MSSVTKNTPDQSVDYDFFSRIHDAPLGEKGNKDREEFDDQQKITLREEQQRKEDLKDFAVDGFQQAVNEQRQEFMQSMHGFDFTEDDFKEAVRKNLENWDEFSADMKPEDAEEFKTLSIMALSATGSDLERIQSRMNEISPDKLQQTEQSANEIKIERVSKADKTENLEQSDSVDRFLASDTSKNMLDMSPEETQQDLNAQNPEQADKILSQAESISQERQGSFALDNDNADVFALDKPDSVISATFSEEVAAIGKNAQSFSSGFNQDNNEFILDEAPEIPVSKSPEPFVLDA